MVAQRAVPHPFSQRVEAAAALLRRGVERLAQQRVKARVPLALGSRQRGDKTLEIGGRERPPGDGVEQAGLLAAQVRLQERCEIRGRGLVEHLLRRSRHRQVDQRAQPPIGTGPTAGVAVGWRERAPPNRAQRRTRRAGLLVVRGGDNGAQTFDFTFRGCVPRAETAGTERPRVELAKQLAGRAPWAPALGLLQQRVNGRWVAVVGTAVGGQRQRRGETAFGQPMEIERAAQQFVFGREPAVVQQRLFGRFAFAQGQTRIDQRLAVRGLFRVQRQEARRQRGETPQTLLVPVEPRGQLHAIDDVHRGGVHSLAAAHTLEQFRLLRGEPRREIRSAGPREEAWHPNALAAELQQRLEARVRRRLKDGAQRRAEVEAQLGAAPEPFGHRVERLQVLRRNLPQQQAQKVLRGELVGEVGFGGVVGCGVDQRLLLRRGQLRGQDVFENGPDGVGSAVVPLLEGIHKARPVADPRVHAHLRLEIAPNRKRAIVQHQHSAAASRLGLRGGADQPLQFLRRDEVAPQALFDVQHQRRAAGDQLQERGFVVLQRVGERRNHPAERGRRQHRPSNGERLTVFAGGDALAQQGRDARFVPRQARQPRRGAEIAARFGEREVAFQRRLVFRRRRGGVFRRFHEGRQRGIHMPPELVRAGRFRHAAGEAGGVVEAGKPRQRLSARRRAGGLQRIVEHRLDRGETLRGDGVVLRPGDQQALREVLEVGAVVAVHGEIRL